MLLKRFREKLQNWVKRIYRKRSLFLATLLFIFSTISPVVAKVASPIPIVQSQQDGEPLANKATELYRNGKFEEAAAVWEQTAADFAAKGDSLNQAMALSNLSLTYQQLGEWDKATKAVEESLAILKTQPQGKEKLKIQAQTLDVLGYIQRERGQAQDALKTWQEATKIYSEINEPLKVAQSKINQAQAMQDLGLYPRACNTLVEVVAKEINVQNCQELSQVKLEDLTKRLDNMTNQSPLPVVLGLRSLGELLRFEGRLEQSEIFLKTSLNIAKKLKSPQEEAVTYLSLGNTARDISQGETIRARRENYEQLTLDYYNQAVKLSPLQITRQQAQLNQLAFLLKLNRLQEAKELARLLYPELSRLAPSHTGVYLQINYARSFIELAQTNNDNIKADSQLPTLNEIDQLLARAAEQARSLGDKRAEAYALGYRGSLYEMTGTEQNFTQAEKFTNQALTIASNFETPDIAYEFFWQLGRILNNRGDTQDAINAYTKAYNALQSLRNDLVAANPEVQFSFRDRVEPVYRELVDLDLQYAQSLQTQGKSKESKEQLIQARNVIESLQLAELDNFFREPCVVGNRKQIDEIDQTAAVIYTILLPGGVDKKEYKLGLILSLPSGEQNQPKFSLYTQTINAKTFEETVEQVRRSLATPDSDFQKFSSTDYKQLYEWLIQPLETELANSKIQTLSFVLDGSLRNIPMAVLYDGNQYLIEKYAIALTPGLQLVDPKPIAEVNLKAFTAGLSEINTPFKDDFQPLENVELELGRIKEFGISDRLVLNEQFTSEQIKKQLVAARVPPIVHLATHGQFSSRADKTFILSWNELIDVKQLGQLLRDNALYQRRPIELLVLSACETAVGDNRAALGLAGVSVRAGARSTLATLWRVEDKSTANVMAEFYSQLEDAKKTKINKAQALQKAQLALLKDVRYRLSKFNHPHFWAPFVLVGNWQ